MILYMSSNDEGDITDSTLLLSADYISILPIKFCLFRIC